jgi:Holliday junction resolvase RusA-like endonuclease
LPSNKHKDWHDEQMWKLKMLKIPVQTEPVCIEMTFYSETKAKGDLDNKATSVLDLMKDVGIIEDDNWYCVPSLILKFGGVDKLLPRCECVMYNIS